MATEKNFSPETIEKTFAEPTRVYPSGSHPGQWRVTGNGLCLVGIPDDEPAEEKKDIPALRTPAKGTIIQTPGTSERPGYKAPSGYAFLSNGASSYGPSSRTTNGTTNGTTTQTTTNGTSTPIEEMSQKNTKALRYFTVITIYQDQVLTPPRADQLNTNVGKRYAERYLKGLGRG